MTPFERLLEAMTGTTILDVWLVVKIGVLVFLAIYFIFTLVVVKQVKIMGQTVTGVLEKELTMAAKILVGLAVGVFVMALIVL